MSEVLPYMYTRSVVESFDTALALWKRVSQLNVILLWGHAEKLPCMVRSCAAVGRPGGLRITVQGYLAHKKYPPPRTLTVGLCLGPYGGPTGRGCFL